MQIQQTKLSKTFIAVSILTLIGTVAWRMGTYLFVDDFIYRHVAVADDGFWRAEGRLIETFSDVLESCYNHYLYINCRLSNIICIFMQLLPRWTVNIFDGLMGFALFMAMMWSTKATERHYGAGMTALGIALFWTAFPWWDTLQSNDFYINYVWTAAGVFTILGLINRVDTLSKRGIIGASILGVIVGAMHEGFTCPLIAYIATIWLFGEKSRRSAIMKIGLGVCLGACSSCLAGVMHISATMSTITYRLPIVKVLDQLWPVYIAIFATIIAMIKRNNGISKNEYLAKTIANYTAILSGIIICYVGCCYGRATWIIAIFSVVQTMMSVELLISGNGKPISKFCKCVVAVGILAYGLWLSMLVKWQYKIGQEDRDIVALAESTERPVIYYDLTPNDDIPFYLMGIINHEWRGEAMNSALSWSCFKQPSSLILSTKYRGLPLDKIAITGNFELLHGEWPMLYSTTDSLMKATVALGKPTPSASPIDWLAMKAVYGNTDSTTIETCLYKFSEIKIDSTSYYIYYLILPRRTMQNREIVEINTTSSEHLFKP